MPSVISYEDAELLGSLSFEAGRQPAYAEGVNQQRDRAMQQAQLLQRGRQQQQQRATQRQQFEAQQAMQQQDRQRQREQQAQQADLEREHETQQMRQASQQQQQEFQRDIQQEAFEQELLARRQRSLEQQKQRGRAARDERRHQQRMELVEHEAEHGRTGGRGTGGAAAPRYEEGRMPSDELIEKEIQENADQLPFGAGEAMFPQSVGRQRERALETAEHLSGLPSSELSDILRSRQSSDRLREYFPYIRSILASRHGNDRQGGPARNGGGNRGGPANLRDMSDEELDEYARSLGR